jgi:LysW-gamma-L-lysine carboxypeptidase
MNLSQKDYSTLTGLISHYSPSGQERAAANWLVNRMHSLGFDQAFTDEAGNAVGVMGTGEKQIVLLGHIDTVPGEIEVKQESGRLYGRGAVDAKGPLACFVDSVASIGAREGWQFIVVGAVEEERDSDGARFAVTQYKPDFTLIGEPSGWDRIALGYKGSAWAEMKIQRGQSHSASGQKTAAEAAVDLWAEIKASANQFNTDKMKLFDQLLLTLSDIRTSLHDFDQTAVLHIGARLPEDITPDDWYMRLKAILKGCASCNASLKPTGYAVSAWKSEKNTPLVRAFLKSIREQGGEPRFVYKTGTTDINIVAPVWACPALVYGPGDSRLDHTPNEHIDLNEYADSVRILAAALDNLVSQ